MAKDITIKHVTSNRKVEDSFFLPGLDSGRYSIAFETALSHYNLYHPTLTTDEPIKLNIQSNFYQANTQLDDHLAANLKKAPRNKLVGYATEALIYQQMLTYQSSGITPNRTREQDQNSPQVQEFKTKLDTMITTAKRLCGPKLIDDLDKTISRKFSHQHAKHAQLRALELPVTA